MVRKTSFLGAILGALALGGACGGGSESAPPEGEELPPLVFPSGSGIQQNLSLASLIAGGWTVCYEDSFNNASGPTFAALLAGCTGSQLMLACRASDASDTLVLAAADRRAVVTQVDAAATTAHHVANGVGWYFTESWSWGFFPADAPDGVNRNPCDYDTGAQEIANLRLCFNASAGSLAAGYRCGANDLNTSAVWRRLVLVH